MKMYHDGSVDVKNRAILNPEGVCSVRYPRLAKTAEIIGSSIIFRGRNNPSELITVPDDEFKYDHEAVDRLRIARGVGSVALVFGSIIPLSYAGDTVEYVAEAIEHAVHAHVTEPLGKLSYMKF